MEQSFARFRGEIVAIVLGKVTYADVINSLSPKPKGGRT